MGQNLILFNRDLNLKDTVPPIDYQSKIFSDIADWLTDKYGEQIKEWARTHLRNVTPELDRLPINFSYMAGAELLPVQYSEQVEPVVNLLNDEPVFWDTQIRGGESVPSFRKTFGNHVMMLRTAYYANWKSITENFPGYGIYTRGPDPNNIIRKITIQPSTKYPKTPPIVQSFPPFTEDQCWSQKGVLDYTRWADKDGSPWTVLVFGGTALNGDKIPPHRNPLEVLITELMNKYNFNV